MKVFVRALLLLVIAAIAGAAPAAAQSPDVTGRWEVQLNAPDGPHKATLTLKKEGEKVTGTIGDEGQELQVSGTQKGADVSLAFHYPPESMTISMTGTQQGDSISGPATFGDQKGDWTGKRMTGSAAPPASAGTAALDISGTWLFEVSTPAGTGTPTITFQQSGESLTGQYVGQLGEAPIRGTLKDAQLSFAFDVVVQDAKVHVTYTGVATNETLKGKAMFGDLGEGAFTARRK